jgi:hypothetical protein
MRTILLLSALHSRLLSMILLEKILQLKEKGLKTIGKKIFIPLKSL